MKKKKKTHAKGPRGDVNNLRLRLGLGVDGGGVGDLHPVRDDDHVPAPPHHDVVRLEQQLGERDTERHLVTALKESFNKKYITLKLVEYSVIQ